MVEECDDLGDTSLLSQSYTRGIKRICGKSDGTRDEFDIADEVIEARKASWDLFFEKIAKATDTTELNYLTLRPEKESSESETSVRIPVRKSNAQIQYWVDTAKPPYQVLELKGSDNESISITESEVEEPEELRSSTSRSMVAVMKPLDKSRDRELPSGSSFSSVDTAAYIKSSANSARVEKRRQTMEPGKLDNSKVARCTNASWPKVVVVRLPEVNKRTEETVEDVETPVERACRVEDDVDGEAPKDLSLSKRRKLYVGDQNLLDIEDQETETVPRNRYGRKSLHPAMDSPSTFPQRKSSIFGPRVLATNWRRSRNNSIGRRRLSKNRSTLFWSKTPRRSRRNLCRSVTVAKDETVTPIRTTQADLKNSVLSAEEKEKSATNTQPRTSSSVGSGDVSQIIETDLNRDAHIQLSTVDGVKKLDEESPIFDEGSVFKARDNSYGEASERRKRDVKHVKKNLYKTLLKTSSYSGSSALASCSILKVGIESVKNSAQPRVILHDFLNLKNCCGKLERENNEYWLRKREQNAILTAQVDENKPNSPLATEAKLKVSSRKKKLKLERKLKSTKRSNERVYKTRFDFATDSSTTSEKSMFLGVGEKSGTKADTSKENVTFSNIKHDQQSLLLVLSSSEDEDIFEILTSISKPKSKSSNEGNEEMKTSKNMKIASSDDLTVKLTKILKILYSSSEEAEEPSLRVKKAPRVARETVKRNKRRVIEKTASGSESSEVRNKESESQLTQKKLGMTSGSPTERGKTERTSKAQKVTRKSSDRKKRNDATQPTNTSESSEARDGESIRLLRGPRESAGKNKRQTDFLSAGNKVNSKNMEDRGSRVGDLKGESKKSEVSISDHRNDAEFEIIDKENYLMEALEDKTNPVDRELAKKKRVKDTAKRNSEVKKAGEKSRKKIAPRVEDERDSEPMEESMKSDDEDRRKNSANIVEGGRATCNRLSTLILDFSDGSSVNDDSIIFTQKNYAGSNSIEESTRTIGSKSLTKLKKRSKKPRAPSKIVYRTKISCETDSDHF